MTPEEHARLLNWADEAGLERSVLARDIVVEGLDAHAERRPMFNRKTFDPSDLVALAGRFDKAVMEFERFAKAWAAHEAKIFSLERKDRRAMHSARAEFLAGFPERIAGSLNPIRAEMAAMQAALTAALAEQVAAFTASPAMTDIAAALKRIEEHPDLKEMRVLQEAHTTAVRALEDAIKQSIKEPKTVVRFLVWDRDWSVGQVMAGLALVWLVCVGSYHGLARVLPASWLAVRSSDLQTGNDPRATCTLLRYRFSTDDCSTRFDGATMRVTVVRNTSPKTPS